MGNSDKLGVGIVGLGLVADEHIKGYLSNKNCKILGLCSRDKNHAEEKAIEFGIEGSTAYDNFESMLKNKYIDIVSICTPNNMHAKQGIAVAESGKHLVLEKPISLNLEDAKELERAVKTNNIKNIVCLVVHWYPRFLNQLALFKQGAIGEVFFADCEYLHGHLERYKSQWRWSWKKEMVGNTILQGGIHAIDAMLQFMESEVIEITAYSHKHTDKYEYDPTVIGILKFEDDSVAKITSTFETEMPYQLNLRLYGTQGTIINDRLWSSVILPKQDDWSTFPAIGPDSGDPSHHPFSPMVDHIVKAIINDTETSPNISDALKSHEVAFAADISIAEKRPVRLPL